MENGEWKVVFKNLSHKVYFFSTLKDTDFL